MYLLRKLVGIQQSILACRSLAGYYRTYLRAGSACLQTFFRQECPERLNLCKGHAHDFQCQTGRHHHIPTAKLLRRLRYFFMLCCSNLTVSRNHTDIEVVSSLIVQTSQRFHPCYLFRRNRHHAGRTCHFNHIEERSAFQHLRIGITKPFQPVL